MRLVPSRHWCHRVQSLRQDLFTLKELPPILRCCDAFITITACHGSAGGHQRDRRSQSTRVLAEISGSAAFARTPTTSVALLSTSIACATEGRDSCIVVDGRLAIGYNILGSYAQSWLENNPSLGIILPEDFTVIMSRIGLVPEAAKAPKLGKDMLRFLMSEEGQTIMADKVKLPALHPDVKGENTMRAMREAYGARLRPISVGPGLIAYMDQVKRARLIRRWNDALRGQ